MKPRPPQPGPATPERWNAPPGPAWRRRLYDIIFEAETPAGKTFDILLLVAIVLSVLAVMLESVGDIRDNYGPALYIAEWFFTALFTAEYVLRLVSVRRPLRYALSFFGVVDLLAILPTYLAIFYPGAQAFLVVRALRLLRMFRVLKLGRYVGEANLLSTALRNSRQKITVFLMTVIIIVAIVGSAMYLVEGPDHGFTSIPMSMYWAIVTMTTVGFGDITPQTTVGKFLACVLMITGYGIIAVPTGIVSVELADASRRAGESRRCAACGEAGHDRDAAFCRHCGGVLGDPRAAANE